MSFLSSYSKKYWKPFLIALICLMVETFCDLMQPTIMSNIIDIGVAGKQMSFVTYMGGSMLLVTLLGATAAVGRNILSSNVSQKFGAELRSDLFKKIQTFSFDSLDQFESASLVTRLTNDVTQVQNFVNGLMRIFVKAPLLCIGSIIMATRLNPQMAVILFVIVPIIGVLILINMKVGYPVFIKVQKALDRVNGVMREYLAGVRVVKAFNRFNFEKDRFEKANQGLSAQSITAMRVMAIFSPGITLTVNLGIIVVLWFGGYKLSQGQMQVGQVMAFINYMTQILFSLMIISNVFTMFVRARASTERIGEVFALENSMKEIERSATQISDSVQKVEKEYIKEKKEHLLFNNVSFTYAGTRGDPVLRNISFSANKGETIGIIGSTGSGKTSLVNLLPRFYDISSGSIKLDGIEIKEWELEKLRSKISIVPQKTILFTGSIEENIRWGKETATQEEVTLASKIAQAFDFISVLPEGFDTHLGQGGINLSGGQKQRVSIARAIIGKPEVLILDDCTSAVDVITESKIREALKTYSDRLTCIVIAQRITSVMGADRIIVLDNGEMVGLGRHKELMQSCQVYQDIFRSQLGKEDVFNG